MKNTSYAKNRLGFLMLGLSFILLSSSCSLKGQISKIAGNNDFKKTEIIASDIGIADGSDDLVVAVHLKNSDNSAVAAYRPEYDIVSGSVSYKGACTTSSNDGISVCILRATQPGTKRLRLKNAYVGKEKDVLFALAGTAPVSGLTAAGGVQVPTAGGYKANVSLGAWAASPGVATPGNYKVFLSVQGAVDSRNVQ